MKAGTVFAALLLLAAGTAVVVCHPLSAWAVGAPADNYTIPDIPTDNATPDEIKPTVDFHLDGPSTLGKSPPPALTARMTTIPVRDNNRMTAGDTWYLDVDINAPGWLYIYEYYAKGNNPSGKWIAYKWRLKESGVWKIGPFSASDSEIAGQHTYRIWFYAGGQWAPESAGSPQNNIITWTYSNNASPLKIVSFEINPPGIDAEEGTLLFWEVQGASSVEISGIGTMSGSSGTLMIKPAVTTTYKLTARDNGGKSLSQSATVTVRPIPFTEQALKFLGNPVILTMVFAAAAIMVLAFILLRRRYAARGEARGTLSLPAPQLPEKPEPQQSRVAAKAILELPGGAEIRIGDNKTIGRADLARVLDIDGLGIISRQHFRITCSEEHYFIEDLGSAGGTRLNGAVIGKSGVVSLKDDDLIEPSGIVKLRFTIL